MGVWGAVNVGVGELLTFGKHMHGNTAYVKTVRDPIHLKGLVIEREIEV